MYSAASKRKNQKLKNFCKAFSPGIERFDALSLKDYSNEVKNAAESLFQEYKDTPTFQHISVDSTIPTVLRLLAATRLMLVTKISLLKKENSEKEIEHEDKNVPSPSQFWSINRSGGNGAVVSSLDAREEKIGIKGPLLGHGYGSTD